MIERYVEHLSADDRAKLNRFLSHRKVTLEDVFRGVVENEVRSAALWERMQAPPRIELSHSEIRAVVSTFTEISERMLAIQRVRGRKVGWRAAEACLVRMTNEGSATLLGKKSSEGFLFSIRRAARLSLVAENKY